MVKLKELNNGDLFIYENKQLQVIEKQSGEILVRDVHNRLHVLPKKTEVRLIEK